eukprot:CAMPEP_0197438244 /NCGR_PEP_ID=MMETSP1175-20131217/5291_1 /TAXON_ID=1003142 /ORGANISM="Triceratium dubium, Strain CCMP147" /LENGTH=330 /DNA_ID=CAMNT_0042967931 /DNA_START=30 /DNA_END=1022 /DNA_ORIENTATION=-
MSEAAEAGEAAPPTESTPLTASEPSPPADEPTPPTETTALAVTEGGPVDDNTQLVAAGDAGAGGAATWQTKTAEGAKVAAAKTHDVAVKAYAGAAVGAAVAADFTKKHATEFGTFVMDGPIGFRVLAFVGGCLVIGASIRDMVEEIIFTDPFQTFVACFNVFFGTIMILLESTAVFKKTPWRKTIYTQAAILKTTFGRGFFYLYLGLSICAQNFSVFSFWIGVYVIALGGIAVGVGWWTQRSLTKLREALNSEELVEKTFSECDLNDSGELDLDEFKAMCKTLGVPMNKVQLMAVFDVIDTSDIGKRKNRITLEEFKKWWSEWDDLAEVL